MDSTDRLSFDRNELIGFDWFFEMHAVFERLLDREFFEDDAPSHPPAPNKLS